MPPKFQPIDAATADRVKAAYARGLNREEAAKEAGCTSNTARRVLVSCGMLRSRTEGRQAHFARNGGKRRVEAAGYVTVYVAPDDPLVGMARRHGHGDGAERGGRAYEHRIVMARALGRMLSRDESVHHINGDRSDNRLENLQLRTAHHGMGRVVRCAECGSYDIVFEELG